MRENTLGKILAALVDDFGYQNVRNSLASISPKKLKGDITRESPGDGYRNPRVRPSAITIVESLEIDDAEKKSILQILARQFKEKTFMPNVNSVRAFLAKEGRDISHIKSRQQAVSVVFECLAEWETHNLHDMKMKGLYGGPKTLAAIADSIEGAAQQNRA